MESMEEIGKKLEKPQGNKDLISRSSKENEVKQEQNKQQNNVPTNKDNETYLKFLSVMKPQR
jgi:hypothetical protein